jgi:uncharacterized protein YkwD
LFFLTLYCGTVLKVNWKKNVSVQIPVQPLKPPVIPPALSPAEKIKNRLYELHNQERRRRNVPLLNRNVKLDRAAQDHNDWMIKNNRLSHGKDVGERVRKQGYNWSWVGENIAMGYKTPETVMSGWMDSSGHRANILNGRFKDVGFGVTQDSQGRWWWTTDFGTEST